jgi:hypothetical protein
VAEIGKVRQWDGILIGDPPPAETQIWTGQKPVLPRPSVWGPAPAVEITAAAFLSSGQPVAPHWMGICGSLGARNGRTTSAHETGNTRTPGAGSSWQTLTSTGDVLSGQSKADERWCMYW